MRLNSRSSSRLRFTLAFVFVTTFAGCATVTAPPGEAKRPAGPLPPSTRPTYNLAGYPPAFKDGYVDGCEKAKGSAYGFKDEKRFTADSQYRVGWSDGFDICRNKK